MIILLMIVFLCVAVIRCQIIAWPPERAATQYRLQVMRDGRLCNTGETCPIQVRETDQVHTGTDVERN